jgi:hypothetical protein
MIDATSNFVLPELDRLGGTINSTAYCSYGETQVAIRAELVASDTCTAGSHTAHGAAPILSLCRKLIEAGVDPDRPLHAYRSNVLTARGFGAAVIHPPILQNSRKRMRLRLQVHARPQYPHHWNWHRSNSAMTTTKEDEFDLLYGSRYLSADDLKGQRPRRTIGKVEIEDLKQKDGSTKRKFVVFFLEEDKGLVLNVTNAKKLAQAFGKDRTNWAACRVELYSEMTSLGKEGVRLQPLRSVPKAPPPPVADDMADEIPYN